MSLIKGDRELEHVLSIKQKALRVNLNEHIYGTFAEIGAGQETVRHFFRAGGASGTIAKAMSAYDKDWRQPTRAGRAAGPFRLRRVNFLGLAKRRYSEHGGVTGPIRRAHRPNGP